MSEPESRTLVQEMRRPGCAAYAADDDGVGEPRDDGRRV
jgi:hypothetical protein